MPKSADSMDALRARAADARAWLFEHALPLWCDEGYDAAADCFHEALPLDGARAAPAPRRVRVQARQMAVYAIAGRLGWRGPWQKAVESGLRVLDTRGLHPDGGTRRMLGPDGAPSDPRRDLYDGAFAIYAFAEAAAVAPDRDALIARADTQLDWLDAAWALPGGGYHEGDANPIPPRRQNPHMHLFEALIALSAVSGAAQHVERAAARFELFRNHFCDQRRGVLREYFDLDWTPMTAGVYDAIEPGHHFEWSWLLQRWSVASGEGTAATADALLMFAEANGVDRSSGLAYDALDGSGAVSQHTARLWPQTERLKAHLAAFERNGDARAAECAVQSFDVIMRYCDVPLRGAWRDQILANGTFAPGPAPASSFYHIMVAFAELMRVAHGDGARRA